jgi:cytochrome c oxidase cbb3-type subunit 2
MRSIKSLAVGAGFVFVTLAMFVQGFLPAIVPESRLREVSRAVRNDFGEIKWVRYAASDYTSLERVGRAVYIREGCWYCHSQYVRPVTGEEFRWGPVSEAGEYAFDLPHLLSTRRIGPDLTRVGLKYGDDWHYAHHWNPRFTVPDSVMPSFTWLFEQIHVPVRAADGGRGPALERTPALARVFTMREDQPIRLFPNDDGLTFVAPRPDGELPIDGSPVLDFTPFLGKAPALTSVLLVVPTHELVGLVRYVQKLGTNRGAWREVFEPQNVALSVMAIPESQDLLARGREVYQQRCVGCHGVKGDGNGVAATFLFPRPRDFTVGVFKFRTTPSGSLPTDGDLFRTLTRGVRWTAMPTWHEIPDKDRLAVITYIKTFSTRWKEEKPEPPLLIAAPPQSTPELLARGKELFQKAKCWECHGHEGRGDGPSANQLKDAFDLPIRPADFTKGQFKGGASVADIFRTMTLGLDGTPMPSYADSMTEPERWAISYYVLSFSAWSDPLTGRRLPLSAQTKAALNAPDVLANHPRLALDPARIAPTVAGTDGGKRRTYYRGISE